MSELGRNKILLLLMADRDALGSTGGNKGYVGNSFIGIDPGHALEGGLLGRRGDVRSDFRSRSLVWCRPWATRTSPCSTRARWPRKWKACA